MRHNMYLIISNLGYRLDKTMQSQNNLQFGRDEVVNLEFRYHIGCDFLIFATC